MIRKDAAHHRTFSGDVREASSTPGPTRLEHGLFFFDSIDIASSVGGQDVLDSSPQ